MNQSLDSIFGGTASPTTGGQSSLDPAKKATLDKIFSSNPPPPSQQDQPSFVSRLGSDFSTRAQNIIEGSQQGATDIQKSVSGQENPLLAGAKLFVHTALNTAGQVAGGATDIIGEGVNALPGSKDTSQITPEAQAFWDKVGSHLDQVQKSNPEVAKALGNIFNLVTLGVGSESEPILKEGAGSAITTTAEKVSGLTDKAKGLVTKTPTEGGMVNDAIRQTEDTMTPSMKKQAIDEGRQTIKSTPTGGTKVDFTPTKEVQRANQILQDKNVLPDPVTAKDAPNVVHAKTELAISKLGADAEKYLEANPVKVSNAEDSKLFNDMKTNAAKTSTATELNAYNEQIDLFQKQLKDQVKGGEYTTANYYKALKGWEDNIASKLPRGKEALLDPTGVASAKIQAASDIRKGVRDMIGSKHPEFQPKMYDLASLYEAKDNALQSASKVKSQSIFEKHPTATKAGLVGAGLVGAPIVGKAVHILQ